MTQDWSEVMKERLKNLKEIETKFVKILHKQKPRIDCYTAMTAWMEISANYLIATMEIEKDAQLAIDISNEWQDNVVDLLKKIRQVTYQYELKVRAERGLE